MAVKPPSSVAGAVADAAVSEGGALPRVAAAAVARYDVQAGRR